MICFTTSFLYNHEQLLMHEQIILLFSTHVYFTKRTGFRCKIKCIKKKKKKKNKKTDGGKTHEGGGEGAVVKKIMVLRPILRV